MNKLIAIAALFVMVASFSLAQAAGTQVTAGKTGAQVNAPAETTTAAAPAAPATETKVAKAHKHEGNHSAKKECKEKNGTWKKGKCVEAEGTTK